MVRKFITEVLLELNMDKIKMDEADVYFSLKRRAYNTRNRSLNERLRLKRKIDKERGHWRLQLVDIDIPGEGKLKGFRVELFNDEIDIEPGDIFKTARI